MSQFSKDLLAWYQLNKRHFPWRENINVYHTWVCEIMSQQTVLSVVLPRFNEFINELPNLESLAHCPDDKLRELWAGLGYYARARNLRNGAKYILEKCNAQFPKNKENWLKVPGCGPYTASIISSVCFQEPVACVDGNVIRVVSRLLCMQSGVWEKSGQEKINCYVNECISKKLPGDFNQAMMDLGATVCKKQSPRCDVCPVRKYCSAFKNNLVSLCPPIKPRKNFQEEDVFALVFTRKQNAEYSLVERGSGFLSKTKGFPLLRAQDGCFKDKILSEIKKIGLQPKCLNKNFRHSITHHKITGHTIFINSCDDETKIKKFLNCFLYQKKRMDLSPQVKTESFIFP